MCGTTASLGTGHTMSMCILAHDGVHWLQHGWRPLPACVCMAYVYVRVLAWCTVHCAYGCTNSCMCVRLYVYDCMLEGELCCMCRRGLKRIVRAMCVSAHAYTAARVYVCVRACSWKQIDGV